MSTSDEPVHWKTQQWRDYVAKTKADKMSKAAHHDPLYRLSTLIETETWQAPHSVMREIVQAGMQEIAALRRFKAYVHGRLDEAGVPTHPEGEHSAAGCRVGDRLDIALRGYDPTKEDRS